MVKRNPKSKFLVSALLIVLVAILLAVWAGVAMANSYNASDPAGASPYVAVYLTSGDVYFGKLHRFPNFSLTDVLYLERGTAANGQAQVGVGSLSSAFWGPTDEINLDARQILFWTPLRNDSQLIPFIKNPSSLNRGSPAPHSGNPANASTSTP